MLTRHAPTSSDLPEASGRRALGEEWGSSASARTGGGRPRKGAGGPLLSLAAPRGLLWSPSRGRLSPAVEPSTCPPGVAAADRLPPPRECQPGPGLFLSALLFVFSSATQREEKGKKAGNCSELIQSFCKGAFYRHAERAPLPTGRKDFQRVLRPCLAGSRSPTPRRCRGETYLFLLVVVAGHPEALPPAPACRL